LGKLSSLIIDFYLSAPQKPKEDWSSAGWNNEQQRPVGRGQSSDSLNHRPEPATWNPPGPPGPRHPSSWNVQPTHQQAPVGRPVEWGDSPTMSRRVPIDDGTSLWGNKQPPNPNAPPGLSSYFYFILKYHVFITPINCLFFVNGLKNNFFSTD